MQYQSIDDQCNLLIAIPTYDGEERVLSLLSQLECLGYLSSQFVTIVVIENPSPQSNLRNSISSYPVQFILNDTQIGLHGSWIKALELGMQYDWFLVLGDDDVLINEANIYTGYPIF